MLRRDDSVRAQVGNFRRFFHVQIRKLFVHIKLILKAGDKFDFFFFFFHITGISILLCNQYLMYFVLDKIFTSLSKIDYSLEIIERIPLFLGEHVDDVMPFIGYEMREFSVLLIEDLMQLFSILAFIVLKYAFVVSYRVWDTYAHI